MKRTAVCSVLFFAMFMVLAGILCMGVAAEENITLVNPFDSSDTYIVTKSNDVIAYRFVLNGKKFNKESEPEKLDVLDLEEWAPADYTVIYVMNNFTAPENKPLNLRNYSNVWIIGATNDIVISKDNVTAPFVNKYGSGFATIKSLTFDGKGSASSAAGITVTGGSLTLEDVTVTNCTGGGVRVTDSGTINVTGNINITGNTANGNPSNLYSESP